MNNLSIYAIVRIYDKIYMYYIVLYLKRLTNLQYIFTIQLFYNNTILHIRFLLFAGWVMVPLYRQKRVTFAHLGYFQISRAPSAVK